MSVSSPSSAAERLAVLLAGGGVRCRRALAEQPPEQRPLTGPASARLPGALLAAARRALDEEVPALLDRLEETGWRWVSPAAADWPRRLSATADPPLGLFVQGRLHDGPTVAVVGSRRASEYGRQVARLLGEELARAGVVVVSGMARGVDAAAHEGALGGGGPTWAVWGCGPDRVYPAEHRRLAMGIAERGALLTEYPPGTPPRPHHFPQRNRLVAGLSDAVVVVEAAARSGALITAKLALDEGREALAVPGSILSPLSVGPNAMLRLGARPVLSVRDVLEAIGSPPQTAVDRTVPVAGGLLETIPPGEAVAVDELAVRAGSDVAAVLSDLLRLELDGLVERRPDGRYSRR